MPFVHPFMAIIGYLSLTLAAAYSVLTLVALVAWRFRRKADHWDAPPPVSVLKPLCGAEPGLYESLLSYCRQDYPQYQIVFGLRDPADPAHAVVKRIVDAFPHLPVTIVVNPQLHGSNCKVSNLINMLPHVAHDFIVMADSDSLVGPDYLATVMAPLADEGVGLVTCLYRGIPTPSVWSRLGAMYINEWYMPSVLLAWLFGHASYVSGQTVCLRRRTLQRIGGLPALANHLADDYRLGELVRKLGLRIAVSHYRVATENHEPSFDSVARHELRWMRTLRVLRPRSFCWIFPTFSAPLATLGLLLAAAATSLSASALLLFGATMLARLILYVVPRFRASRPLLSDLWLLPVRDLFLCWLWWQSFFTSQVTWRGATFDVDPDGIMHRLV
jgi:ceramide glucosyltransferase